MYLNVHSYYSLRYGTLSIEKLIETATLKGIQSLCLTDINNTTGILDFVKLCKKSNIKPLAGIEFRIKNRYLYTGIALNNNGFQELNHFLTEINLNQLTLPSCPPLLNNVIFIYPFGKKACKDLKDNELIGIKPIEVNKLYTSELKNCPDKLIIWQPVTFSDKRGYFLHQHLRAIDNNILLSKLTSEMIASEYDYFIDPQRINNAYKEYPEIIKNTEKIIEDTFIDFDYKTIKNKKTFTGSPYDDKLLLEKLAFEGLEYRYGKKNKNAAERVNKELEIINKLGFSAYFLITWDIIRYSLSRGFYHVGRGSGANSIVAYCLKITDVDPIELDLYFERFLNPKRTNPPDFDIDYSWKERDQVQDYIFKRYGRAHTALLGALSTFKGKSIIRELAKVYGLPKQETDDFILHPHNKSFQNDITRKITEIGGWMTDFPNIRSIHAGGILISEEPITAYTALDLPPKGFPTTQWDMYVAEDFGFEKIDILSQRGIGHIKETVDIVKETKGISIDFHRVEQFKKDEKVKDLLRRGETNGCFYIESPAMRGLLKKLRCDNYISLVAASSIIRPGVAKSGMMREYIYRFHHPNNFKYLHPVMEEQLKETYGVMVYQEDVIKVCHHFAGLDLADSDVLRRAMSGKFRSKEEFNRIVDKFFANCREKGYSEELTNEVWRQIASFAGYSFSKAHSASYAVESYQSLYLKAYYPLEFMVAVINNFGGYYQSWVYFEEAKRWGAKIQLPCVNSSEFKTSIKNDLIFVGFIHIKDFENKIGQNIPEERRNNGLFVSLDDFINRVPIGLENLLVLIRTGAFRTFGKTKSMLMWEAHMLLNKTKTVVRTKQLFGVKSKEFELPQLLQSKEEDAFDEIELIGFPLTMSYFEMLKTKFRGEIFANELNTNIGKKIRMIGNLVTLKYVRTVKKEIMYFGTFLDFKGEFFDTVHFPDSLKKYPLQGGGIYLILGQVTQEFDFPSITVEKLARLPLIDNPRYQ